MSIKLRVLSLGAGVQSTTVALMYARGEIEPMPDAAIFADTQAEPTQVYHHLSWLKGGNVLPYPVYVSTAGSLTEQIFRAAAGGGRNDGRPPFFIRNPDGSKGMLRRQCTQDFKLLPIHRQLRELLGLRKGQSIRSLPEVRGLARRKKVPPIVEQIIGISLDEQIRRKPSRHSWITNVYPLVDQRMTRTDCEAWLVARGYQVPFKSACVYCPFRSDLEWLRLREADPPGFDLAVRIDAALRSPDYIGLVGEAYLHSSLKPLDQVEFDDTARPRKWFQDNLFLNDCEGMCGV